jgi:hypothetical protein
MMSRLPFSEGTYEKTVPVGGCKHPVGDPKCGECWGDYPKTCECGGCVHAQFVKENWDKVKVIEFSCDKCVGNYKVAQRKYKPRKEKGRTPPRRRFM